MTTEKKELLENFKKSLAELTTAAVEDLSDENKVMLMQALASGAWHIRLVVIPSPLIIIGALHNADRSIPAKVLFRIEDIPSGESH